MHNEQAHAQFELDREHERTDIQACNGCGEDHDPEDCPNQF